MQKSMHHVGKYANIAILVHTEIIPGGVEILVICRADKNIMYGTLYFDFNKLVAMIFADGQKTLIFLKLRRARTGAEKSEERHRPDLDALAEGRVGRRGGILKGGVADEAGAAVSLRFVGLQEHNLVRRHLREVPPLMLRRVAHHVVLAVTVAVMQVKLEEVLGRRRGDVAHG